MKNLTVRARIIAYFSAATLLLIGLCVFAYIQLQRIRDQASIARSESVPGLALASQLQAVSISTYSSVEQLILERDSVKRQQIKTNLGEKTAERLNLLKQYESVIRSDRQRELLRTTEAALIPYMTVRKQVEQLSGDPETRAEAAALLQNQLQTLYDSLQGAIQAEVDFNRGLYSRQRFSIAIDRGIQPIAPQRPLLLETDGPDGIGGECSRAASQ
jgi:CHASE3 domain sensor protein